MKYLLLFTVSVTIFALALGQPRDAEEQSRCQKCADICASSKIYGEKVKNFSLTIWNRDIVSFICKGKAASSKCYQYLRKFDKLYGQMTEKSTQFIDEHEGCASLCQALMPIEEGETCVDTKAMFGPGGLPELPPIPDNIPEDQREMIRQQYQAMLAQHRSSDPFNASRVNITLEEIYLPTCAECKFGFKLIQFFLGDILANGNYYIQNELEYRIKPLVNPESFQCKSACTEVILDAFNDGKEPLQEFLDFMDSVTPHDFCYEIQRCKEKKTPVVNVAPTKAADTTKSSEETAAPLAEAKDTAAVKGKKSSSSEEAAARKSAKGTATQTSLSLAAFALTLFLGRFFA